MLSCSTVYSRADEGDFGVEVVGVDAERRDVGLKGDHVRALDEPREGAPVRRPAGGRQGDCRGPGEGDRLAVRAGAGGLAHQRRTDETEDGRERR